MYIDYISESNYVLDFNKVYSFVLFENNTFIKIPKFNFISQKSDIDFIPEQPKSWLPIIGSIILGVTGIVALLLVGEYYAPTIVQDIPFAQTIVDTVHIVWNSIVNWFYPGNNLGPSNAKNH